MVRRESSDGYFEQSKSNGVAERDTKNEQQLRTAQRPSAP
jgi:hypothetical protein